MPKPKKHTCTGHIINLCPDNKEAVCEKIKEMRAAKASVNFSQAINDIIFEWQYLKDKI